MQRLTRFERLLIGAESRFLARHMFQQGAPLDHRVFTQSGLHRRRENVFQPHRQAR